MNHLFSLIVFTANILGSFNDPFEFEGNYGDEINPVREYVFEQVVSKEALARNLSNIQVLQLMENENPSADEIKQYHQQLIEKAVQQDIQHGPTLSELVSADLIKALIEIQLELQSEGFCKADLQNFLNFINRYEDRKVFALFQHLPPDFLNLDKILRDQAAREGKAFGLPILSSTTPLESRQRLLESIFTKEILKLGKSEEVLKKALESLETTFLETYLGKDANTYDLAIFTTPAGQTIFYWLYQTLNLHLVSQNEDMLPQINLVKQIFAETLGNPLSRAEAFRNKLISSRASIVFTQESDALMPQLLSENELFHSVRKQNPADGTFVFLRKGAWAPDYEVIKIDGYEGFSRGRLNVILATQTESKQKFLLASCHGHSTKAEDGRLQITKIMETFYQLSRSPENKDLQLVIGIDANTKSEEDVKLFREHLDSLGLIATNVGPTTIKKRMVTAQHSKAGRSAVDEEDYIIILKPENGGLYQMAYPTVGFREEKPDPTVALPNIDNPSDHYPVGVTLH